MSIFLKVGRYARFLNSLPFKQDFDKSGKESIQLSLQGNYFDAPMTTKEKVYRHCVDIVKQRIQTCKESLNRLQESLASETKSTAGDKHETGRAMIQLEREQIGVQLAVNEVDLATLQSIQLNRQTELVQIGSLVKTSKHNYFMAVSGGKITLENQVYYLISLSSPIGQVLKGKKRNDTVHFRKEEMKILTIE